MSAELEAAVRVLNANQHRGCDNWSYDEVDKCLRGTRADGWVGEWLTVFEAQAIAAAYDRRPDAGLRERVACPYCEGRGGPCPECGQFADANEQVRAAQAANVEVHRKGAEHRERMRLAEMALAGLRERVRELAEEWEQMASRAEALASNEPIAEAAGIIRTKGDSRANCASELRALLASTPAAESAPAEAPDLHDPEQRRRLLLTDAYARTLYEYGRRDPTGELVEAPAEAGQRAAFEAWAQGSPYCHETIRFDAEMGSRPGEYYSGPVQLAWEVWQAALAAARPSESQEPLTPNASDYERGWSRDRLAGEDGAERTE